MAYRRSLTTKGYHLGRRYCRSLSHIAHHRSESDENVSSSSSSQPRCGITNFVHSQTYNRRSSHSSCGFGALLGQEKCVSAFSLMPSSRPLSHRFMSSGIGEGSDNIDGLGDFSEIMTDTTMEVMSSQAPVLNEVSVAAADSSLPVAAVQYLLDAVHSFTGLNWWATIAVTTILLRVAVLPFSIHQLKATYKLKLIKPRLEEIRKKVQETGMDPMAVAEGKKEINALLKEYGVGPFAPFKEVLVHAPVFLCFFFAIFNMVEKVPSFKTGGALWFTDLTTPDSLCIFPLLASLSFLITVEGNLQEGNPGAGTMKNTSRIFSALIIPFTLGFPKALLLYWITSNLFTCSYGLAIKHPEVRKLLDLPGTHLSPFYTPQAQPNSSPASALDQHDIAEKEEEEEASQSPKSSNAAAIARKDAVLRQRIRSLQKQLKEKKKTKKP